MVKPAVHCHSRLGVCSSELIVIYITVGGSSMPLRVMESDSIASVKLRIQAFKGFVVKGEKLVFGGREQSMIETLVKEYCVARGDVLYLALNISDLLLINLRTTCGREFKFQHREKLEDQKRIDDVFHLVIQKSATVWTKPAERDVELSIVAPELNERTNEVHNEKNKCLELQVFQNNPPAKNFFLKPIIINPRVKLPSFLWDMIHSAYDGLVQGKQPIRSSEGTGGTYFMQDASGNKYISIFKPIDEEPLAANNPQGLPLSATGEGLKRGTRVGEGAMKEVAAYILDYPKKGPQSLYREEIGFAGVPPTIMAQCLHKMFNHPQGFDHSYANIKIGSLQMFMKNHGSCEDMGPRDFPIEEVHKICVFDMRMANADRHAGNILHYKDCEKGRIILIPIDHGYCLPEHFEDCTFDWLYWPQARVSFSQETLDYINSLNAEQDIVTLKFYGLDLSPACTRTLRIATMILKKGAIRGLTPFMIGSMMCRETLNKKSIIEEIIDVTKNSRLSGTSETTFLKTVSDMMDATLDKLLKQ